MEDKYHVIFGRYSTNIYPATVWGEYSSYNEMITNIHDIFWGESKNVQSITMDKNQFVVFGATGYGSEQAIISIDSIQEYWSKPKNYMITSCFPYGSSFYFVMTKNAPGHPSLKSQTYHKRNSWNEISQAMG